MKKSIFTLIFISILTINYAYSEIVSTYKVTGNSRVTKETIGVFGDIKINENYDDQKINDLIKKLYDTNFFSYIEVNLDNGVLEISVKENPVIQTLTFKGIKAEKFRQPLLALIELKEKSSFVESKLDQDVRRIKNAFRTLGYFFVEVEAFKKENVNNSIDLIYEVNLGKRAKINKIKFIGDKKYKDSKLRGIITSEEGRFWKFLSEKKYLNQERIELDSRLLENFYKNKGFYQVKVLTTNVIYEDGEGFLLTYNINAGPRFIVKNISLKVKETLNKDYFSEIEKDLSKLKNEYYSPRKIKKILDDINKLTNKKDLQFIESKLEETIENDKLLIVVNIEEGEKTYVERINIIGNSITNDNVIRGELEVDEGDPYSLLLVNKSVNNLKARRIFANVVQSTRQGSSPDLKVVNIEVEEKPTGEITAGAGVGSSGGQFGFGVSENNFLGSGITLDANLRVSEEAIRGRFGIVNPNYNYTGNTLKAIVESTQINKLASYGYDTQRTGFTFGTSFEQYEDIYISPNISAYYEDLETNDNATAALKKQQGTYIDTDLKYSIMKDKRDQKFQPTDGYRTSFTQKIPLYSDSPSLMNGLDYSTYHAINENIIGSIRFYSRMINSIDDSEDVKVSERLYLPARYLRGFEPGKIGPQDTGDYIGGNYATALGFNASLPNMFTTLPNTEFSLFLDTGNVWGVDYSDTIDDGSKLRSAIGINADWFTPVGPLNFSISQDLSSAPTDTTESFRFNIGTTF